MFSDTQNSNSIDIQGQIHEWKLQRQRELILKLSPRKKLVMGIYHSVFLGTKPIISLVCLAAYAAILKFICHSTLFLFASIIYMRYTFDQLPNIRIVPMLLNKLETIMNIDHSKWKKSYRVNPLSFEDICYFLASLDASWYVWKLNLVLMRLNNSYMFFVTATALYLVSALLTSLFNDSTIFFILGMIPAVWPAMYHYDLIGMTIALFQPVQPVDQASNSTFSNYFYQKFEPYLKAYQEYTKIPEEFQPKESPSTSSNRRDSVFGYADYAMFSSALSFLASSAKAMQTPEAVIPEANEEKITEVPATVIPRSDSPTTGTLRNRTLSQQQGTVAEEFGFELVNDKTL